ncbi:trypsin-like serine peptidase [Hypericibacter sp.]|uniref:trypsin-like serine peptidase n=1 Tax=Hypericibacter sp. TaxID=2705401 RepID=UPI003D6D74BF
MRAILAGLAFILTFVATLATGFADDAPAGTLTAAQASKTVEDLGIDSKPSSDAKEIEVTWVKGKVPVPGSITLNVDAQGKVRAIDPLAPIPADRILFLSRETLQNFTLRWNSENPGAEHLDLENSGVLVLTATYPRASAPYDAAMLKRQIGTFRSALDRALDDLDRESKAHQSQGDKAYASDWELADPSKMPARAVGRLETQGGYICTATLVAEDIILTAAHCVMDDKGRHKKPLQFNAGIDHGDAVATANVTAVHVDPDYDPVHQFDGKTIDNPIFGRDWALLKLDAPIGRDTGTIDVFAATRSDLEGIVDDTKSDVIQIGYGGQGGFRPKLRHRCGPADVLDARYYTTQCGLVKGDSGSPLLLHQGEKYRIIGINYAWVDLDYVNHVFLVVGSAAFAPTLKDLVSGKLQATPVEDWIKDPSDDKTAGTMGQPNGRL